MLLNSYIFILAFLPAALAGYYLLNRMDTHIPARAWLVGVSVLFYWWGGAEFLALIVLSAVTNYLLARIIHSMPVRGGSARVVLTIGLLFNLGLLGYYKYADFFISNFNRLTGADAPLLGLALPLAISFYSLQQVGYLMDVYEGLAYEPDPLDYALFVLFFPKLLVGPIVHHKEMMPQFRDGEAGSVNYENISKGAFLFSLGLFKKVVLAAQVASYADAGFSSSAHLTLLEGWVTSLSYTLQLYFDFSGYTDMAIGAAMLFNVSLPINFNSPFKAVNIIEFWQRWHMTLTNLVTTYVYTPIVRSGGRVTFSKSMFATLVVLLVIGFWHGAAWTFVVFGLLHGIALIINHISRKRKLAVPRILSWALTLGFVNATMVLFRAKDMGQAAEVLKSMAGLNGVWLPYTVRYWLGYFDVFVGSPLALNFGHLPGGRLSAFITLSALMAVVLAARNSNELTGDFSPNLRNMAFAGCILGISIINMNRITEFIYLNF